MRLTKRTADALEQGRISDDRIRGLSLRARGGSRRWYLRFQARGRRREMPLGEYPAIGISDARKVASELLQRVAAGEDPAADRRRTRYTVADLFERAFSEHWHLHSAERTQEAVLLAWRKHIRPALGRHDVEDLTTSEISRWHAKTGRDRPGAANRALAYLSKMLSLAVSWGIITRNPAKGVRKFPGKQCERFLTDAEYARLWEAINSADDLPRTHLGVLALLTLTGMRKSEALSLRWSYIELELREMRLPRTKTGRRTVLLSEQAAQVLETIRDLKLPGPWVFPQKRDPSKHLVNVEKTWKTIRERAGIEGVRIHDLRHSFASMAIRRGVGLLMVKELLGHKSIATTQRYTHLDDVSRRGAVDVVGGALGALRPARDE